MTHGPDSEDKEGPDRDLELDQRVQDILGRSLKAHFEDIVASPMPDRFLVLLTQLEAKEAKLAKESDDV